MAVEQSNSTTTMEPLAIVGLSFKLPQDAVDEASFWKVMENRKNLSTDWPADRSSLDGFFKNGPKEPNMVRLCANTQSYRHIEVVLHIGTDSITASVERYSYRQPRPSCL